MNRRHAFFLALVSILPVSCSAPRGVLEASRPLEGARLGSWTRPIDTPSREAQQWFDRGLTLDFAFNHDEAIACFQHARELDPTNPMPWWGIALASGPHINNTVMSPEQVATAWTNLQGALERKGRASAVNRALIDALAQRYTDAPITDRAALDQAYATAMCEVAARFPRDADVVHLWAESLMNLQPWDLWNKDGTPKGRTLEVVAGLERALAQAPEHPGLNHLYIHAVEASREPAKAKAAADRLRTLVPDAGHLVHMPSHIDLRLGHYELAVEANREAMAADARAEARTPKAGFYRVYMAHNAHFLSFASMMEGNSEAAIDAARTMAGGIPPEFIEGAPAVIDGYVPVVFHALVRFGRWEEILAEPAFPPTLILANGMRHYARGVALTALDRLDEARVELAELRRLVGTLDDRIFGINSGKEVMAIAIDTLEGELAFRAGEHARGLELVKRAVAREDDLRYMEPPDWPMPVRHPYGAMLLEAKEWKQAEQCFREDLARFPENGWALFGLTRALRAQARNDEAADVEKRFKRAWSRADVELHAPCFCQPGNGPAVTARR